MFSPLLFILSSLTCWKIQNEESVVLFLVVWTVTEITRYSFYTFKLLNHLPYFIKWARWRHGCSVGGFRGVIVVLGMFGLVELTFLLACFPHSRLAVHQCYVVTRSSDVLGITWHTHACTHTSTRTHTHSRLTQYTALCHYGKHL